MKQLLYVTLGFLLYLTACNSNSSKTENKNENTSEAKKAESKAVLTYEDSIIRKKEALKKMPALSIEQLKEILPEKFNGVNQRNYASNSTMGYTYVEAEYPLEKKSNLKITLNDCTGQEGANLYESSYLMMLRSNNENETEYTKVVNLLGEKAIEYYNKTNNHSILTYSLKDRVLVVMQGINMKPDALRSVAEQLDLKLP